jgi:predicted thioesterase
MNFKGRTAEVILRVHPKPAEVAPPEGDLPPVLPISRISQLMEQAAARLMRPMLRDGESSLAVSLNLTHVVTGPISGNLRAVATHQGAGGREHRFLVHVFDESGLVASAEHRRAIVGDRRVVGLARRGASRPPLPLDV